MKSRIMVGRNYVAFRGMALLGWLVLVLAAPIAAQAVVNSWTGTSDRTNWFNNGNWSQSHWPDTGEDVVISNAYTGVLVLLTNSPAPLNSLTITNATLVCSNWNTAITSTTITVYGTLTHLTNSATTTNASGQWVPDARVYLVCSNLTVAVGGAINVTGKGYLGGQTYAKPTGCGPGGGTSPTDRGGGGGYGGAGGRSCNPDFGGPTYGIATAPEDPGSGGGYSKYFNKVGGAGGGAIRIDASGTVALYGVIQAHGGYAASTDAGYGSGGGIFITCRQWVPGTNAQLTAIGLNNTGLGGGGGGGRIAVCYNAQAQSNLGPVEPSYVVSVAPGYGGIETTIYYGVGGSVYFTDIAALPVTFKSWYAKSLSFSNTAEWATSSVLLTNSTIGLPPYIGLRLTNNLTIISGSWLQIANAALNVGSNLLLNNGSLEYTFASTNPTAFNVGGSLLLTNAAALALIAGPTNSGGPGYGGLFDWSGRDLLLPDTCKLYLGSNPTNGGSVLFRVRNLTVSTGAQINATGYGFAGGTSAHTNGYGPGGGTCSVATRGGGGGYGGAGGKSGNNDLGGPTYGSSNTPVQAGSGGGFAAYATLRSPGSPGGSVVRIEASGILTLRGTIVANGNGANHGGGGAGGGIYLKCGTLMGASNAMIQARGGDAALSTGGGGGGGRVAIWRLRDDPTYGVFTNASANGGSANGTAGAGANGTVVWGWLPPPGSIISIR